MKVLFLEPAREEFSEAVTFYEEQASGLGAEFIAELEESIGSLETTPALGAPYIGETRRIPLHRFPYSIVYLVEDDNLVILAVAHQRRQPGHWKDRI